MAVTNAFNVAKFLAELPISADNLPVTVFAKHKDIQS